MTLAVFDPDKHHIALSEDGSGGDGVGFITSGSYSRGFRREKESQFDGIRYGGGDSLVNKPGVSSWTQDDFTGGAFQYVWGKDEAQFARSKNALPSQFDRSIRSVPALQQWLNGTRVTTTDTPLLVFVYNGFLYAFFAAAGSPYSQTLYRWDLSTGAVSSQSLTTGFRCRAACFDRQEGVLWAEQDGQIGRYIVAPWGAGWTYTYTGPTSAQGNIVGISADGDRVVMAYENVLWTLDVPDDRTTVDAPQSAYVRIGRLPGRWVASSYASGLLYVLCSGADTSAQLVAFDGTQVLPITELPYNFVGQSLCSYGGRIYIGGSGADVQTGAPRYAELYEVTGASLRLLKTFAPELLGAGEVYATSIRTMAVHEGLLFFPIKGVGLCAYDLTTDSFVGASVFSPTDSSAEIYKLVSGRESLFSWVYPIAANPGDGGWFRPATSQETVATYNTEVETSDFAMAFDRTKRWRQLRVLTRFVGDWLTVSYSVDGGTSWTALAQPTLEQSGRFQFSTFDLSDVPESRMIRFKFSIPNGTNVSAFRELVAFTASFRFLDSDSVGSGEQEKLAWTFVICGSDRIEAADRSTLEQDVDEIHDQLWYWARGRKHLNFRDLDGLIYTVEIDTLEETQPTVLPALDSGPMLHGDSVAGREAFYRVTLVEV